MWVVSRVLVVAAPLEARGCQLEGGERAGAWSEAARDGDGLLPVPAGVGSHDLGLRGNVLWGKLGQFVGLRVHPPQRLHVLWRGGGKGSCDGHVTVM